MIGVSVVAYEENPEQDEPLINPNVLLGDIDKRPKKRVGRQSLIVDSGEIPINLEEEKLSFINNRCPTPEELRTLTINWIVPFTTATLETSNCQLGAAQNLEVPVDDDKYHEPKIHPDTSRSLRRNQILNSGPLAPLDARLGNCLPELANRTLLATTYLRDGKIETDQQEIPRTNGKKRGATFSQRRLEGRTNSDTFVSYIKSIRGYRSVQLFIHLLTQYLWIACLRQEKDNHRAYQEYIREVGTPNILLTDNANSQVGKKWTGNSCKNMTQQRMSAPDKHNKNASERKVNDVKHMVASTLFASNTPIVLWWYCMQFFVYSLNMAAWRRLNYRTPTEALLGLTPDISHLKFTFWKKSWYYEYNHKFTNIPWKPCRVVMFADHQGDQFSYNIWTVDDDENREKGKELTWYILITRVSGPEPSATSLQSLAEFEHDIQFKKLPKRHQRKKTKIRGKRNRKREAYRDLKPGPTQRKQQKESPWTDHINDDLTMCTADLTED